MLILFDGGNSIIGVSMGVDNESTNVDKAVTELSGLTGFSCYE